MKTIIKSKAMRRHSIEKYNLKVLSASSASHTSPQSNPKEDFTPLSSSMNPPQKTPSDVDSSSMSKNSKDALIESLMKKTDEMSSNFITLQMKLESKEEEYKVALEKIKEEAFSEGVSEGIKQPAQEMENRVTQGINQFGVSVATLDDSAKEFVGALENIKSDLMLAAIDIAKEVVDSELNENSNKIAKNLSDSLIKELQSASKITLKVNPKNHGVLSEQVGSLEYIEIVSDSAIGEGGVIAMSDAGNIDSQISKRFEKVKRAALSE